jgi:hypothetical protein
MGRQRRWGRRLHPLRRWPGLLRQRYRLRWEFFFRPRRFFGIGAVFGFLALGFLGFFTEENSIFYYSQPHSVLSGEPK